MVPRKKIMKIVYKFSFQWAILPYCTCKQEEGEDHDGRVAKVQECGCGSLDLKLGHEVVDAVNGQIESREPGGQEAAPPPVVILDGQMRSLQLNGRKWENAFFTHLSAQVEVAEEDGRLGAGDDQDDKDQEEETVHVVDLGGPDRVENEEELDEDATEGEDAAHYNARDGLEMEF